MALEQLVFLRAGRLRPGTPFVVSGTGHLGEVGGGALQVFVLDLKAFRLLSQLDESGGLLGYLPGPAWR